MIKGIIGIRQLFTYGYLWQKDGKRWQRLCSESVCKSAKTIEQAQFTLLLYCTFFLHSTLFISLPQEVKLIWDQLAGWITSLTDGTETTNTICNGPPQSQEIRQSLAVKQISSAMRHVWQWPHSRQKRRAIFCSSLGDVSRWPQEQISDRKVYILHGSAPNQTGKIFSALNNMKPDNHIPSQTSSFSLCFCNLLL